MEDRQGSVAFSSWVVLEKGRHSAGDSFMSRVVFFFFKMLGGTKKFGFVSLSHMNPGKYPETHIRHVGLCSQAANVCRTSTSDMFTHETSGPCGRWGEGRLSRSDEEKKETMGKSQRRQCLSEERDVVTLCVFLRCFHSARSGLQP